MTDTTTPDRFPSQSFYEPSWNTNAVDITAQATDLLADTGWSLFVSQAGGGVLCLIALHEGLGMSDEAPDLPAQVWIGTADINWGWSDDSGEQFGDIGTSTDERFTLNDGAGIVVWDAPAADVAAAIAFTLKSWIF